MSDEAQNQPDELTLLKQRADRLGVQYSNNIGVDTLKARIAEKTGENADNEEEDQEEPEQEAPAPAPTPAPAPAPKEPETKEIRNPLVDEEIPENETPMQMRARLLREARKLVRIRITCMDPKKREVPGEIITVGNKIVGTFKKYVPFGEATDNGFHVPAIIYKQLEARRFQQIIQKRDRRTGTNVTRSRWVKEFSIEVLPPLTEKELKNLADQQAAAGSIDNDD